MTSGREVEQGEHRMEGRVFVARPTPQKKQKLPRDLATRQKSALRRLESLKEGSTAQ